MNINHSLSGERLNILLLCAGDHRAAALGACGPPCLQTPHWD